VAKRQRQRGQPAPQPRPGGRSPLTPFYVIIAVIAVVGVGALLYQMRGGAEPARQPVPVAIDPVQLARTQGIAAGSEDAPVVIFEFADYQCPGCMQFATFVAPLVKDRYVDRGLVRYVFYDFPLPSFPHSFLAARAARCAGDQGAYWQYHDVLFGRQQRWSSASDPTTLLLNYAGELNLDRGEFESCVRSDRHAADVSQSAEFGRSLGVQGTPTLFVNGRRLPNVPSFSQLEAIIQQELGTVAEAPPGTVDGDAPAPGAEPDQTGRETPGIP
jgi:protein-disulfide isomerase